MKMNGTQLKILALVLMLIDHIAEFIPGIPVWFHWLGRISAPLFMYCMIWGVHYTHNRKKYLIRMYLFGVVMAFMDIICNNMLEKPYQYISNNIFVTLLLIGIICCIFDIKKSDKKKGNKYLIAFCLFQIVSIILCMAAGKLLSLKGRQEFTGALFPNLLFCEGSFIFVFLGVFMYYARNNRKKIIIGYTVFSAVWISLEFLSSKNIIEIFTENYQWMMIAALPFMLSYNGKKGSGLKYLFYLFYPIHIFILFVIGNLCF